MDGKPSSPESLVQPSYAFREIAEEARVEILPRAGSVKWFHETVTRYSQLLDKDTVKLDKRGRF